MGLLEKIRSRQALHRTLDTQVGILERYRGPNPELQASVVGLRVAFIGRPNRIRAFLSALMMKAGEITKSVDQSGRTTERFVVAGSSDLERDPWISLLCFNRGAEQLEIAAVTTQARLLALQHDVQITSIESFGFDEQARIEEQEGKEAMARSTGRRIKGKITIKAEGVETQEYVVDINVTDQLKKLSPKALLFTAREYILRKLMEGVDAELVETARRDPNFLVTLESQLEDPEFIQRKVREMRMGLSSPYEAVRITPQKVIEDHRRMIERIRASLKREATGQKMGFTIEDAIAKSNQVEAMAAPDSTIEVLNVDILDATAMRRVNPTGRVFFMSVETTGGS